MPLTRIIERDFDRWLTKVHTRVDGKTDWQWLLHTPNQKFLPDYFTIGSYGNGRFQRWINTLLSASAPSLWSRFLTSRLLASSFFHFNKRYTTLLEKDRRQGQLFLKAIDTCFTSHHQHMFKATFVEVFHWFSEILIMLAEHLNHPIDHFSKLKAEQSRLCTSVYLELRRVLKDNPQNTELLIYLAIRSNWLDVMDDQMADFMPGFREEINELLDQGNSKQQWSANPYTCQISRVAKILQSGPRQLLYELDNAGEAVIDLLLIEHLLQLGHQVTITCKPAPTLNDFTEDDLRHLLDQPPFAHLQPLLDSDTLRICSTGSTSVGRTLTEVSSEYKKCYQKADLLILKGQGHFQSMPMGYRKKGRFIPHPYRKPFIILMGIKTPLTHSCLKLIHSKKHCPPMQTPYCIYFNPENPATFPM